MGQRETQKNANKKHVFLSTGFRFRLCLLTMIFFFAFPFAFPFAPQGFPSVTSFAVTPAPFLVVLCGERGTQPIVNTGTLYS